MINSLQKNLYKIGCIAPILITLGISLLMQKVNWKLCIVLIIVGILASIYTIKFITLCKKKLATLEIKIESIEQNDTVVIMYSFSYLFPMVGIIWSENTIMWLLIGLFIAFFYIKMNSLGICPMLLIVNYHFYMVSLSTGVCNCILVSKRKVIRSSAEIKKVVRVSENFLIDEEEVV